MKLKDEFRKMTSDLAARFTIPPIKRIFLPPFYSGGQPKDAQFMAIGLEGGAVGISFVLLSDEKKEEYRSLQPSDFVGKDPGGFALNLGDDDPLGEMIGMAACNAICQHVVGETGFKVDHATDSLGLLSIARGDKVGMIGLFFGLFKTIVQAGADLVVVERNERLIKKNPDLPITMDMKELGTCNKILCTSMTVLNDSLDEVLSHCPSDAFVAVIGPTAGYFPDPLFARGVDILGGRVVKNGARFLQLLAERKRWGNATEKVCFQKETYTSII